MKPIIFIFAIICGLGSLRGSAETQEYRIKVGAFDRLNVTDNVEVRYRCEPDSSGYVVYRGEEEFADAFIFTNNKGQLRIQVNTEDVDKPNLPVVYAYSDYLTGVENSSTFTTTVTGLVPVPKFSVKLIGNGRINASGVQATEVNVNFTTGNGRVVIDGKTEKTILKMVGTGFIQALDLDAETVECKILGGGMITCDPTEKLDVRGIGSTKIYYKGNPEIKKVGGGKLYPLLSDEEGEIHLEVAD